ncbi:MAG: class I SAM-dependent methyltransferase [Candidatus Aminicenantes bacterium]|nr:class I SAM-dependent methyltransferase [Candidatus Aminicenantes bacterium]
MAKTAAFEHYWQEYEKWFEEHHFVFLSEIEAIKKLLPPTGRKVEIGVGSGLFASALKIEEGCDPSLRMRQKAQERGIKAIDCVAENLPYENQSFDVALLVTTICFVDDPERSLKEINRILKPGALVIVGLVDAKSPLGKIYLEKKDRSFFYREARFFSCQEVVELLEETGFEVEQIWQTVFGKLSEVKEVQQPKAGSGEGGFVVISARKTA